MQVHGVKPTGLVVEQQSNDFAHLQSEVGLHVMQVLLAMVCHGMAVDLPDAIWPHGSAHGTPCDDERNRSGLSEATGINRRQGIVCQPGDLGLEVIGSIALGRYATDLRQLVGVARVGVILNRQGIDCVQVHDQINPLARRQVDRLGDQLGLDRVAVDGHEMGRRPFESQFKKSGVSGCNQSKADSAGASQHKPIGDAAVDQDHIANSTGMRLIVTI